MSYDPFDSWFFKLNSWFLMIPPTSFKPDPSNMTLTTSHLQIWYFNFLQTNHSSRIIPPTLCIGMSGHDVQTEMSGMSKTSESKYPNFLPWRPKQNLMDPKRLVWLTSPARWCSVRWASKWRSAAQRRPFHCRNSGTERLLFNLGDFYYFLIWFSFRVARCR